MPDINLRIDAQLTKSVQLLVFQFCSSCIVSYFIIVLFCVSADISALATADDTAEPLAVFPYFNA